jgi:uncharacterized protein
MQTEDIERILLDALTGFPEIRLVYLFGSRLEDAVGPLSDYDFGVLYAGTSGRDQALSQFSHLLTKKLGSRVDVVSLSGAPVDLAYAIISSGRLLYETDVTTRVDFESRVMGMYYDQLYFLRENRSEILSGGDHAARVQRYREAFRRTSRTLGEIGAAQG